MPTYKDEKRGTWYCKIRYTDWQGNRKETTKRGFATKREAKEYEAEYLNKMAGSADMTLQSLYDIYIEDRQHKIKESSLIGITTSMNRHVLPSLGKLPLSKITPNVNPSSTRLITNIFSLQIVATGVYFIIRCRNVSRLNFSCGQIVVT